MREYKRLWAVLSVGAVALILQFGFDQGFWARMVITVLGGALAVLMFVDMVKTLRAGNFGVDLLAITAIVATLAVGEYWAAIIVLLMLTGGDALEDFAANKANSDLQSLLANNPTSAHRVDADGQYVEVAADDLQVDDKILVRPGEVVPADAIVLSGASEVDEASLTGEARPIAKTVGDDVMSGSINGEAALTLKVAKRAKDSQYQSIVALVAEAESRPAHFVRMADRYAVPFTLVAYLIAGIAWFVAKDPVRAAQVLVVASPCPLILAAPVAMVSGMSRASREGIIVKSGTTLEKLAAAKTFAFDKTGTLTRGVLTVDQVLPQAPFKAEELLVLAASCEQQSGHILARSLVAHAPNDLPKATEVNETTGLGVAAQVSDHAVKVGQAAFVEGATPLSQTAVYVQVDGAYAGAVTFSDELRPEAQATISDLHAQGVVDTVMISGDQQKTADAVAQAVGIDHVYAHKLPAEKISVLETLTARPVVMVGDGVNDAPSLAAADVGIAMGAHGATAASESADAVVLRDDLSKVAQARVIGTQTLKVAKEAVWIGIAICTGLMLIAATGVIPTIIGALFQEVVDTVTILYALKARNG